MANRNFPLDAETLDFVKAIPALAMTTVTKVREGRFTAYLDVGPRYVSDASPSGCGGATPQEASEAMKAWLLDDLACKGQLGKRHYQPHWDRYDLLYRLGKYWKARQAQLPSIEAALELLQAPEQTHVPSAYEGWTNSATYLVNMYTAQSSVLYDRVVALFKAGKLTAAQLSRVAPIVRNRADDSVCGFVNGKLRLDTYAAGAINWSEMVENWLSELTPASAKGAA